MLILTSLVENIHCSGCESVVRLIADKYFTLHPQGPDDLDTSQSSLYSYSDGYVTVSLHERAEDALKLPIKGFNHELMSAGYPVTSWTLKQDGRVISSSKTPRTVPNEDTKDEHNFLLQNLWSNYKKKMVMKHHVQNCTSCQLKRKHEAASDDNSETLGSSVQDEPSEFRAVLSISGMSCASCSRSVESAIASVLLADSPEKAAHENLYSVDLIQQTAVVVVPHKQQINKIIDAINDAGFTAQLVEVLPIQSSINLKVTAIIGGITCAACVNSVTSAVKDLPFVLECGVNAVTRSGQFVLEEQSSDEKSNIDKLKATIEDCGFDFEFVSLEQINYSSSKRAPRTINIEVDGMFCTNCPDALMEYLGEFGSALVVEDPITLDHPFIKFTYIANLEKGLTVRRILKDINHLKVTGKRGKSFIIDYDTEGNFKCKIVEKVSIEDHIRSITRQESLAIIKRLVMTITIAIPTFVFGIVGMSLIKSTNGFRKWLEEPIWAGNTARVTWILFFLSTPIYFFAADVFHVKAIKEIRSLWFHKNSWKKRFFKFGSMSLLMSLGTTVAYFASIVLLILASREKRMPQMGLNTSYFDSVVFLTLFLLIGRYLESLSKAKTADALSDLSSFKTTSATIVDCISNDMNGETRISYVNDEVIGVELLDSGDCIKVSSGESPPVDCVIVQGLAQFDESALTGEAEPISHLVGQQIFAGTVNVGPEAVIARVLDIQGTSLIDRILSTVRDGQMRKAPIQRLADVLTGYFVPIIVMLAILTWVIWLSLAYSGRLPSSYLDIDVGGWAIWSLEFAIAVFVVACPCGIGLAAPTALFVGSGLAAKHGILARGGGAAFQDAAQIGLVCFDKTGTLTEGVMKLTDVAMITSDVADEHTIKTLTFQISRDLELASKHPIASAIKDYLLLPSNKDFITNNKIPRVETIPGKGLKGQIVLDETSSHPWATLRPEEAILGNEALLHDFNVQLTKSQYELIKKCKEERKSIVLVAIKCFTLFQDSEFHLLAALACYDQVRSESKLVVEFLKKKGVDCWMITGDNKITAHSIGKQIGLDELKIISGVLPDEKKDHVLKLKQETNKVVAMVGDGINDAPALAAADVGVSLSSGADLAVTASEFIILSKSHPILTLCTLLDLSKVVFQRVKFNFGWSLIYNLIGVPIAAGVIYPYHNLRLSPVWASAAMALSSLSVITSSLLLRFYRPKLQVRNLQVRAEEETEPVVFHSI